jgi:hypothetical protein
LENGLPSRSSRVGRSSPPAHFVLRRGSLRLSLRNRRRLAEGDGNAPTSARADPVFKTGAASLYLPAFQKWSGWREGASQALQVRCPIRMVRSANSKALPASSFRTGGRVQTPVCC